MYAYGKSKWPIRDYAPLKFNVNSHYGGLAALYQISCSYGGKGEETTSEVFLLRCGYSGNFIHATSLAKDHSGHFGNANNFCVEQSGRLVGDNLFGTNHISVLANDGRYGNLNHGRLVHGGEDAEQGVIIPLDANGSGNSLVVCSGTDAQGAAKHAIYMIRTGFKDDFINNKLIHGDDDFKFTVQDSIVCGSGVKNGSYALYHNQAESMDTEKMSASESRAGHSMALDGSEATEVVCELDTGAAVVLCSTNSGTEDATAAAVYLVTLTPTSAEAKYINGSIGNSYDGDSADLWKFQCADKQLRVTGPASPCRYAFISNLKKSDQETPYRNICLATGEDSPLEGGVTVNTNGVTGWVSKASDVIIKYDEVARYKVESDKLCQTDDKWAFSVQWQQEDKAVGLHLIQVFAVRKHATGIVCHIYPSVCCKKHHMYSISYIIIQVFASRKHATGIVYIKYIQVFAARKYATVIGYHTYTSVCCKEPCHRIVYITYPSVCYNEACHMYSMS